MLYEDNATGDLRGNSEDSIIAFPGKRRQSQDIFGPVSQEGSLDGILVGLLLKERDIVIVPLESGQTTYREIETDLETTFGLARHMGKYLRIFGTESRVCDKNGDWNLKGFRISSYKVLRTNKLTDVMHQMRAIEGSEWRNMEDPIAVLNNLRDDSNGSDGKKDGF